MLLFVHYCSCDELNISQTEEPNIYDHDYYDSDYVDETFIETCDSNTHVCVRKCCLDKENYNLSEFECISGGFESQWVPQFYSKDLKKIETPENIKIIHSFPCQMNGYIENNFHLQWDGLLYTPSNNRRENTTLYCIDNFFNKTHVVTQAFVCFPQERDLTCREVKTSLLVVSASFMLMTIVVYLVSPELRSNMHGKVLISYVSALFISYIDLAIIQFGSQDLSSEWCKFMHGFTHYFMLASFFWLNTMSFDVWRSLRSMRPQGRRRSSENRRLMLYSLYSWGCPLIIVSVTVSLDHFAYNSREIILPQLGVGGCWFESFAALWVYMYGYILIIMVMNTMFFGNVAWILYQANKSRTNMLKNNTAKEQERMWMYMKIFLVMGITWVFEVASASDSNYAHCNYWIFTDSINALQGLWIFLVFICKKSTLNKMKSCVKKDSGETTSSWSSKKTGTSTVTTNSTRDTSPPTIDDIAMSEATAQQEPLMEVHSSNISNN